MPRLILSRHGQTDYNAQRRYQGQTDIPLNETGLAQAEALQVRLAKFKLDAAYCSDLSRAYRTAQIALSGHPSGLTPRPLSLLREVNGGEFEGLVWDQIQERYPDISARWQADRASVAPPGGENLEQVRERVKQVLDMIAAEHPEPDQNVLVLSHGGIMGVFLCHLMGVNLKQLWQWRVDTCSISIIDLYKEGAILSLFNDTAHIDEL